MLIGEMGPRFVLIASLLCVVASVMPADDTEDRGKLAGKWQPADGQKSDYGTWVLEAKETGVRVIQEANGQKVAERMQHDGARMRNAGGRTQRQGLHVVQRTQARANEDSRFRGGQAAFSCYRGWQYARTGGHSDRSRRQNRDCANEPLPNAVTIGLAPDPRSLQSISRTSHPGAPVTPRRDR